MKLDYYTLLCPVPISLSIGTIKAPTLREIGELTYSKYTVYQLYLRLKAKDFYDTYVKKDIDSAIKAIPEEEAKQLTIMQIISLENEVRDNYLDILNFFFLERVEYVDGVFFFIDTDDYDTEIDKLDFTKAKIKGAISDNDDFLEIIDILQQVCCIKSDDVLDDVKPKFKNKKAKILYERMLKANEKKISEQKEKEFKNFMFPNLISSIAAKCPGLNIVNIWDATPFQVYDQFEKTRNNDYHYINSVRVSVWGDEDNSFDQSLWYKNNF